jgi:hypothetical protein
MRLLLVLWALGLVIVVVWTVSQDAPVQGTVVNHERRPRDPGVTDELSTRGGDTTRNNWWEGGAHTDAPEFSLIFRP